MTQTLSFTVTAADTAIALGSGDVPVLATPRLLAWLEAATVAAAGTHLAAGQTSVGTEVAMRHRRATAVGRAVDVEVTEVRADGSRLEFEVAAYDDAPAAGPRRPIATAVIGRAVVDREAFTDRLG